MSDLVPLLERFGLPVVLVLIFVWQQIVREKRTTDRIEQVENYVKQELVALVRESQATVSKNSAIMERLEKHLGNIER